MYTLLVENKIYEKNPKVMTWDLGMPKVADLKQRLFMAQQHQKKLTLLTELQAQTALLFQLQSVQAKQLEMERPGSKAEQGRLVDRIFFAIFSLNVFCHITGDPLKKSKG